MGAAALPSIITAGAGLIGGKLASDSASKQANAAKKSQDALTARQTALYDQLVRMYNERTQQGTYNPDTQVSQAQNDLRHYENLDKEAASGAAANAGYQLTDSEPNRAAEAIHGKYGFQFASLANQIRQGTRDRQFQDLRSIDSGQLNPAINVYGQQYQSAMARMPDMGQVFASLGGALSGLGRSPNPQMSTQSQVRAPFQLPQLQTPNLRDIYRRNTALSQYRF